VKEFSPDKFIIMATQNGTIKKTNLSAYGNVRRGGIIAINIVEGDDLIEVKLSDGTNDVIIGTRNGMAIRFNESDVREMGRTATGVRGIKLSKDNKVVSMLVVKPPTTLLAVTDLGYGKRSDLSDYRITRRGGKGIITIKTGEKTGHLIAMKEVNDTDELMIITDGGMVIRQGIKELRVMGRNTQGVRLIRLKEGEVIADIARVIAEDDDGPVNGNEEDEAAEELLL
jgi:DNA gyrase subunit A